MTKYSQLQETKPLSIDLVGRLEVCKVVALIYLPQISQISTN
jgi:hypothetical protein